jgi:Na+/serine symporter
VAILTIDALKIPMICVHYGIWDNSVAQGMVAEGTIMQVLVDPGETTIMIPHAMMARILGPNADKTQIWQISEDRH